jgi:hypothetical protein
MKDVPVAGCCAMPNSRISAAILALGSCLAIVCAAPHVASAQPAIDGALPQPLPLFPADNWWNVDISQAPLDPNSAAFIGFINNGSSGRRFHPDFGGSAHDGDDPAAIYGIPYISVSGSQPLVPVTFIEDGYGDESDAGAPGRPPGYPIPEQAKTQAGWIEAGAPGNLLDGPLDSSNGDRHMLIVDRDNRILYELYRAHWNASLNRWEAESGAVFPLTTNLRRPDTWTSADAAGLAIMPGLVRYDEAYGAAPIRHAFRVTVRSTNGYVFPASHRAGSTNGALPMGARLRMKANVDISGYPAAMQRVFQAMKTYGLIVADNGSDMYVTGSSDPRWEPQMDDVVQAFHSLNANQFDVVQLGWQPTVNPDNDSDGLPDAWETQFGLGTDSADGDNGPNGDPDGDLQTNAQEYAAGTHPNGKHQAYFAEGASNDFFATRFALLNPGQLDAHVQFRYMKEDGNIVQTVVRIGAHTRYTEDPALSVGKIGAFSTTIESDEVIVADRTMVWDSTGYGATAETSRPAPATSWFFAEGATSSDFRLFYLLENPGESATTATVRYLLPFTPAFEKTYDLAPHSRKTIQVDGEDARLKNDEISAVITAPQPIIAERAMYRNSPGHSLDAGHESAGVTGAATRWFLAEGATGFFDLFVLIANPDTRTAELDITYLLPGEQAPLSRPMTVPGGARRTITVKSETFAGLGKALASTQVATIVTSTNGVPIVVERAMWWPAGVWYEAHNSPGATVTSTVWASGEGELGGQFGTSSYYLIANTSPFAGRARVTLMFEDGTTSSDTVTLGANSRTTVSGERFDDAAGRRFGVLIESLAPTSGGTAPDLVCERAMYWNANGQFWAAGTNALLTPLAPATP